MIIDKDENETLSKVSNSTKPVTQFTDRDLNQMTKRQLLNLFKKVYSTAEEYLKSRLENIDIDKISTTSGSKGVSRESIISYITQPSNFTSLRGGYAAIFI